MSEEIGISLGTETVIVRKSIVLKGFRYEGLDSPGNQVFYLEYLVNGGYKQKQITGYTLYDFYMNLWNNGNAIKNIIEQEEGVDLSGITLEQMEYQFVAGLPTEPVVE